ncbi:MAG: sigma-70 family RNA polymerase sigma factor [Bacteroidetes bacterium]|nr:sigma-70 family RNA polymerase sigma factor [Bacteroidota bacterium]
MENTATISLVMTNEQNQSIGQVVQKEQKRLLDFIRKRVPSEEDAEDILQDVFYQLTESYRLMKPIEQVSAWLFTVARNKITDMFRKKKPDNFSSLTFDNQNSDDEGEIFSIADYLPDASEGPEAAYLRKVILNTLDESLKELPQEQRDVFVMQEMEQMSFKQIAELTGEPVNTLISRKRYAVLHLRERLKEVYNELLNI